MLNPLSADLALQLSMTCGQMRLYAESVEYAGEAIRIAPDYGEAFLWKAWMIWQWKGDAQAALKVLDTRTDFLAPEWSFFRGLYSYYNRQYDSAEVQFSRFPREIYEDGHHRLPFALLAGVVAKAEGRSKAARGLLDLARAILEELLGKNPEDQRIHGALGWNWALLGRRDEAHRHGQRALELFPATADRVAGDGPVLHMAYIHAALGEPDEAVERLATLLLIPSSFVSPASLRSNPMWDPLRKHPRSIEMVNTAAVVGQ